MFDIEVMFHQVLVQPQDRDLSRFLWWPDGDVFRPAQLCKIKVYLYGALSSPSYAAFSFRQALVMYGDKNTEKTADTSIVATST